MARWQSILKNHKGQAVVEMVVVVPFLAIIILGMTELGTTIAANLAVVNASREGARIASRGNVYADTDIVQVIEGHSGSIDLASRGSIVISQITSTTSGFTSYTTRTLLGGESSRYNQSTLTALYNQASAEDPSYLKADKFVIIEVFYRHNTITGFLMDHLDLYNYAMMPVSAPS